MSPYIGRSFEEVKRELEEKGQNYSWEIASKYSGAFDIDTKDLYCLRELESSGEKKLVLGYLAKVKPKTLTGGNLDGV